MALIVFDATEAREMAMELARRRGLELHPVWIRRRACEPLLGRRDVKAGAVARGPFPSRRGEPALVGAARDVAEVAREREENPLFGGVGMLSVTIFYENDERALFEDPGGPAGDAPRKTSREGRAATRTVVEKAERRGLCYGLAFSLAFLFGTVALIQFHAWLWPPEGPPVSRLAGGISLVLVHFGLAALAAAWLRRRYYRGLVRNPPRPSEAGLRRASADEEKATRWLTLSDDERSLEYMRDSGRAAAALGLVATPFAAGLFGLSVPAGPHAWFVAGHTLLVLCAAYALLGASERVRSFAYPERPGAAATAMLLVGLLCLLVGSTTLAVSVG